MVPTQWFLGHLGKVLWPFLTEVAENSCAALSWGELALRKVMFLLNLSQGSPGVVEELVKTPGLCIDLSSQLLDWLLVHLHHPIWHHP